MFTTPTMACRPLTAAAAWIFVPLHDELKGNLRLILLWHEWYNPKLRYELWGGVLVFT
jgi:hypothetical protein